MASSSTTVPFATTLDRAALIDKIRGLIYGNALGDAVGVSTEFLSKEEATNTFGDKMPFPVPQNKKTFHSMHWLDGDWTDDTDQMILILESLLDHNLQVDRIDFAKRLLHWMDHGFEELGDVAGCGTGFTVRRVLTHKVFLENPHEAAQQIWEKYDKNLAANGAIMRTSILAVPHFDDLNQVTKDTVEIAKVTHADTRCVASCVAATRALALMLQGKYFRPPPEQQQEKPRGWFSFFQTSRTTVPQYPDEERVRLIEEILPHAEQHLDPRYKDEFERHLKATILSDLDLDQEKAIGYTLKCLGSGFWGLSQNRPFKDIITELVLEGGDSDTNGAVCGALVGCKIGYSQLPKDWIATLRHKDWLEQKVVRLLQMMKLADN